MSRLSDATIQSRQRQIWGWLSRTSAPKPSQSLYRQTSIQCRAQRSPYCGLAKQLFDDRLVGRVAGFGHEAADVLGAGQEPGQVERDAADQRRGVGGRPGLQSML